MNEEIRVEMEIDPILVQEWVEAKNNTANAKRFEALQKKRIIEALESEGANVGTGEFGDQVTFFTTHSTQFDLKTFTEANKELRKKYNQPRIYKVLRYVEAGK